MSANLGAVGIFAFTKEDALFLEEHLVGYEDSIRLISRTDDFLSLPRMHKIVFCARFPLDALAISNKELVTQLADASCDLDVDALFEMYESVFAAYRYTNLLVDYFSYVSKDNTHIVFAEELSTSPVALMSLFTFLGINNGITALHSNICTPGIISQSLGTKKLNRYYRASVLGLFSRSSASITWLTRQSAYSALDVSDSASLIVYSHRRSGTHFVMKSLELNFGVTCAKRHDFFIERGTKCLYVVRDGRDVLTSCYHWWQSSGESKLWDIAAQFNDCTFETYVSGHAQCTRFFNLIKQLKSSGSMSADLITDPIGAWVRHVSFFFDKMPFVRYEELKLAPEKTIERIGKELGLRPRRSTIVQVQSLVGHHPRKGIVGDHKSHFDKHTQDLFWDKAGKVMTLWGYTR